MPNGVTQAKGIYENAYLMQNISDGLEWIEGMPTVIQINNTLFVVSLKTPNWCKFPNFYQLLINSGQSAQPYKYNGKEFIEMHGYDTYDYGFRGYYAAETK